MFVYRVAYKAYARSPLDGEGSYRYGARWSSRGTRMAYTSSTTTLAMLEFLAHLEIDADVDAMTPPPLVYVTATIPDADIATLPQIGAALPSGWDDVPAPATAAELGDAWIARGRSLALIIPSIHVPRGAPEHNVLINPQHPNFGQITWKIADIAYDRRLLSARAKAMESR